MPSAANDPRVSAIRARYWRSNVRIMLTLLSIWALAGLGCGVLFADWLNQFRMGGIPLGFWFAQQGSILVFVVLILAYALLMRSLDRSHREEMKQLEAGSPDTAGTGGQSEGDPAP
ncbi:MAG: DUF4212 domain-containing protein [Planctomycetota bacterium]|nr:DUF4212 domain-containing protein [Planctomycetota bacterium]